VQAVFDEIRDFILPPAHQYEICDWSSPRLPEVSDYFTDGMEWWGVFLFSIYVPALKRLTIVAGSTTD
jgi:steroid 5-alpha reductase family enzyme